MNFSYAFASGPQASAYAGTTGGSATASVGAPLTAQRSGGFSDGYAGHSGQLWGGGGQSLSPAAALQQLSMLTSLLSGALSGMAGGSSNPTLGPQSPQLFQPQGQPQGIGGPQSLPGMAQGQAATSQGPASVKQLIQDPKSLGEGAGMKMLPPDSPPEAYKQALEQRFGQPFDQIRQQYAEGKEDPKMKGKKSKKLNKVGPAELYKQMIVESEFGKIGLKGHDGKVGGQGKLSGLRKSMKDVNESYSSLYQAKGGSNSSAAAASANSSAAEGAAGSSVAISAAVTFMNQQGIPVNLAMSVAMSESGQAGGVNSSGSAAAAASGGGIKDQAAYAKAKASYEAAVKSGTPILLDLAGTGIPPVEEGEWKPHPHKFTAKNKRMFDLDADGVKELVEWVNPGGALLCQPDAHDDVPNGKHLFGDAGGFKDGYSKMAHMDPDNKGFLSLADLERNQIQVWVDETGDALVSEGELRSCRDLGISKIYTAHSDYKSTFVQDGEEKATWDWWPSYRKLSVGARV